MNLKQSTSILVAEGQLQEAVDQLKNAGYEDWPMIGVAKYKKDVNSRCVSKDHLDLVYNNIKAQILAAAEELVNKAGYADNIFNVNVDFILNVPMPAVSNQTNHQSPSPAPQKPSSYMSAQPSNDEATYKIVKNYLKRLRAEISNWKDEPEDISISYFERLLADCSSIAGSKELTNIVGELAGKIATSKEKDVQKFLSTKLDRILELLTEWKEVMAEVFESDKPISDLMDNVAGSNEEDVVSAVADLFDRLKKAAASISKDATNAVKLQDNEAKRLQTDLKGKNLMLKVKLQRLVANEVASVIARFNIPTH